MTTLPLRNPARRPFANWRVSGRISSALTTPRSGQTACQGTGQVFSCELWDTDETVSVRLEWPIRSLLTRILLSNIMTEPAWFRYGLRVLKPTQPAPSLLVLGL